MIEVIILIIITIFTCIYLLLNYRFQYWKIRGVPYLQAESYIYGNDSDIVSGKLNIAESLLKKYNRLAPHRFGGVFSFYKPILYIRDADLVKRILIKDFHHFHDRSFDFAIKEEPLTLHLFNLSGEEWTILRQKLTPTFTSGKMKLLFVLMKECLEKLNIIIDESVSNNETLQIKDLMGRYTTDVISSCAFGLEADSLHNPNSEFREKGKAVFNSTPRARFREALFNVSPRLTKWLGLKMFPQDISDFFINWVRDTIEYREKSGVVRNDFLNLLISIQKEEKDSKTKKIDFDIGILTAQCFVFFLAGFETSSNALSFILYELSENLDVQKKLQEEVDYVLEKYNGQITYDSLQEMNYMEKVFNETSRLFPAISMLFRTCTEDYHIPDSDYTIEKGQFLFIPIYALHRDPRYFPNPNVFNPENFSEEAKASRPSCCFLPFGDGPRICIGLRFGMMQIKLALTAIMSKYTVTIAPEMKLPMELKTHSILPTPKNEILLNFIRRNTEETSN